MKIALVSDAWAPQVNGVVRTLTTTVALLRARGHKVETITPDQFSTIPCPSYPEIRIALGCGWAVAARLKAFDADAIHIATEGPLGWAARRWCRNRGIAFTTSFHTRFPDYVAMRSKLPADWFWPIVRRFHGPATRVFAATETLSEELAGRGLPHTHRWSRGVDLDLFAPGVAPLAEIADLARPIQLSVGRVAIEKNIEAFLQSRVPGTKVVVGDGPARAQLERRYPDVVFLGALHGERLAAAYAAADVFVFPSLTDTFGLVMIEALASGVPVAGFPVQGPIDIIGPEGMGAAGEHDHPVGVLDDDLETAIGRALLLDRDACAAAGRGYGWDRCTDQFVAGLSLREKVAV
ncbi:MAG TPA: glycosyltransferase family 1 protein [Sphingomonas sp.]|nr:glycosyltransferase family 1 protein [Sphingomonas sp.]